MRRTLASLVVAVLVTACSAPGFAPPSSGPSSSARVVEPYDNASALPGDNASALPGAQLACWPLLIGGNANCSVAINLSIPPLESPTTPSSMIPGLHPSDLQSAYALPVAAAGETIAIVDAYDDPNAEADLGVYRTAFGLPACTAANGCFKKINQSGVAGSYPSASTAWSQEVAIDLDMVSAACPRCSIVLVEASSASIDDLGSAVDTAVASGAKIVSNSYYSAEWSGETGEDPHYDHSGVTIVASSGDQDWPSYPAASPYVVAVGGTSLQNGMETPWTYAGHGCSRYESAVAWQQKMTACTTRSALDVAASADPQYGVAAFDSTAGGWLVAGGTSVAAPIVASAYALAGNGGSAAFTYAHASGLHDVGPGAYGTYTGLGSPNGITSF